MDRLEHTGVLAARVEVRCGRNTDGACKGSGKIGKNIGVLYHIISIISTETRRIAKGNIINVPGCWQQWYPNSRA